MLPLVIMSKNIIPIKVINLKTSVDRRQNFISRNQFIKYDFFEGIRGDVLTDDVLNKEEYFINPLPFPSLGAYGCALSHLSLWEHAIQSNNILTVAEDDAIFRKDFIVKSEQVISKLPTHWDFILWGWNFDSILSVSDLKGISPAVMLFNQNLMRQNIHHFINLDSEPNVLRLDKCFGIPAYSISPNGAKKFKSLCFPMKNFELYFPVLNRKIPNTGIDIAMNRIYSETNSFVAFPPLVITENLHEISTIQRRSKN